MMLLKSLISMLFCCVTLINGSHPSAEIELPLGVPQNFSSIYYANWFWIT
jgi:hypothetical protein